MLHDAECKITVLLSLAVTQSSELKPPGPGCKERGELFSLAVGSERPTGNLLEKLLKMLRTHRNVHKTSQVAVTNTSSVHPRRQAIEDHRSEEHSRALAASGSVPAETDLESISFHLARTTNRRFVGPQLCFACIASDADLCGRSAKLCVRADRPVN